MGIVVVALAVGAGALYLGLRDGEETPDRAEPTLDEMASDLGAGIMRHLFRGHVDGRSGELMLVPRPHHYLIGPYDYTTLGTDTPWLATSHPNPWNYIARVPIVFSRPGFIPQGREIYDEVDISQVAPTIARLLGMDDFESASCSLEEIVACDSRGGIDPLPKAIFMVVLDGGGWNALQEHPDSWPAIERLRAEGTTYVNATIGSAPSITGALHATFGTGFYPNEHGLPGNQMRGPEGKNTDTWRQKADPQYLLKPAVSELWDEQNGNEPVVGTVSYEGWHLGMIGHGAQREGGDHDVAALWEVKDNAWWVNERYYELPESVAETDLAKLESYEAELDPRDGINDGLWFGHTLEELQDAKTRPGTPAFARFTGEVVTEVMRDYGVGEDDLTDIFWVEMKMPDFAGHLWNMTEAEEADVLRETDRQIGRFVAELDRVAGRGNYVFGISADHGQQPLPEQFGGWRINQAEFEADVEAEFGDVIEKVTPVDMYVDMAALEESGASLEEIARWIAGYTLGENIPEAIPGADLVPEGRHSDRLFVGAFPTGFLSSLDEDAIESFGEGEFEEGDFTIDRPAAR